MRVHMHALHVGVGRTAVENINRQRRLAKGKEVVLELVMRTVVEEAQRTATARGVVIHLGDHRAYFVEEELVADTDLTRRLHQHIPQMGFLVQLAKDEHLNLGISLLLGAIQTGGEHLRVVEHKRIAVVEIVDDIAEIKIIAFNGFALAVLLEEFYLTRCTVQHHQA